LKYERVQKNIWTAIKANSQSDLSMSNMLLKFLIIVPSQSWSLKVNSQSKLSKRTLKVSYLNMWTLKVFFIIMDPQSSFSKCNLSKSTFLLCFHDWPSK
jgi:hypothetical protein